MPTIENLFLVFIAGLVTALATGLGAVPFFLVDEISDRWNVALWGLASGIMLAASTFGLIREGLSMGSATDVVFGLLTGVVLVLLSSHVLSGYEFRPREIPTADFRRLVLIVGTLTVHSFPEGVAIGVSFAALGAAVDVPAVGGTVTVFAYPIPLLAVFITVAIAIQNIPEGLAVSIPLRSYGARNSTLFGAAVFSSLPQPIAAVIAYYFVQLARELLPYGLGFAAGAMIFLVIYELLPEAHRLGRTLPGNGRLELGIGLIVGIACMIPLLVL